MKKILSLFLSIAFWANINGYASNSSSSENQFPNATVQTAKTKNKNSYLGLKIGIGVGVGAAVCTAIGLAINYFCQPKKTSEKTLNKPTVSDEEINHLEHMAVALLCENANKPVLDPSGKRSHIRNCYDTYADEWVSPRLAPIFKLIKFKAIESPKSDVSIVFTDTYAMLDCFNNIRDRLAHLSESICPKAPCSKYDEHGLKMINCIAEIGWQWGPQYKREYVELFRLYKELKPQYDRIVKDSNHSVSGFLIIENRSFGSNELARYYVRTVNPEELKPKMQSVI